MDVASLTDRYRNAGDETRRLVDLLLEQDDDDHAWTKQLGAVYRQGDVARLLGRTKQAVSADKRLLRLELRSGAIGYPAFQFDGRRQLPGVAEIVTTFGRAGHDPWTTASWLTSPQPDLEGDRPLDRLRAGDQAIVTELARRNTAAVS